MLGSVVGAFVSLWSFMHTGPEPLTLFLRLMGEMCFVYALITLTVGPIAAESVPAQLMSTGSGVIIGIGEIFGGGLAPALVGYVAKHFGIVHAVTLPLWALGAGLVAILFLKETAPARVARASQAD